MAHYVWFVKSDNAMFEPTESEMPAALESEEAVMAGIPTGELIAQIEMHRVAIPSSFTLTTAEKAMDREYSNMRFGIAAFPPPVRWEERLARLKRRHPGSTR